MIPPSAFGGGAHWGDIRYGWLCADPFDFAAGIRVLRLWANVLGFVCSITDSYLMVISAYSARIHGTGMAEHRGTGVHGGWMNDFAGIWLCLFCFPDDRHAN